MSAEQLHFLTYQHNIQSYFREHRDKYDGIIIPLSIITSFPTGTYGFIRALCSIPPKKHYGIDPRSALFQKKWNRANVRDPHRRMAEVLGSPFTTVALTRQLLPSDFSNDIICSSARINCDFQQTFRNSPHEIKKINKYKKMLGLTSLEELGEPQFLIPPYFQFSSNSDPWLSICLEYIKFFIQFSNGIPVRPVVHFASWTSFDWRHFVNVVSDLHISSVWIYPNNFKEHEASQNEAIQYIQTVKDLSNSNIAPYALFGGFLAICLSKFGLNGFSNGIGFGEWRDSGYHKGGSPDNRIYIPKLHRYLDPAAAQALIERDPEYFAYDSDLLGECVDSNRSLLDLSQAECLDHFIECRAYEIAFVQNFDINAVVDEFSRTCERLKQIGQLEYEKYGTSLDCWSKAFAHHGA